MDPLLKWEDVDWCIGTRYADNRIITLRSTLVASLIVGDSKGLDKEEIKAYEKADKRDDN